MTFGWAVEEEIRDINTGNRAAGKPTKYSRRDLANASLSDTGNFFRKLAGVRRIGKHFAVQLIAVLGPTEERATELLHLAGYDISTNGLPENKAYRRIIELGPGHLDEKNALLSLWGEPIGSTFVRLLKQ